MAKPHQSFMYVVLRHGLVLLCSGIVMRYILPVFWMTSYNRIMALCHVRVVVCILKRR